MRNTNKNKKLVFYWDNYLHECNHCQSTNVNYDIIKINLDIIPYKYVAFQGNRDLLGI